MSAPSPSRAQRANDEALRWLAKLDALATNGDSDAIRMFHSISCGMVQRLNEMHLGYADSVLEWPVLLPQDRDARSQVTMGANAMRIGSVRGGGQGAGKGSKDVLNYDSQKGFAIENLRRLDFARSLLSYTTSLNEDSEEAVDSIPRQIRETVDDPASFAEATGILHFDKDLLLEISRLPDYSRDTKEDWIRVIVAVLRRNSDLVPPNFPDNKCKIERSSITKPNGEKLEFHDITWSGARLAMTLRGGLDMVSSVPGFWGQGQ